MANEYLVRTPTVTSNQRCWTWSGWIRRSVLSNVTSNQNILRIPAGAATGGDCAIRFDGDAFRVFINGGTTADLRTAALLRDPQTWIHLHVTWNSSSPSQTARLRLYINGINQLSYSTETYPSINAISSMCGIGTTSYIGCLSGSATVGSGLAAATEFLNAEIADFYFIDGLAITPDQFGFYKERRGYISAGAGSTYINDFRSGQWVPKTPRAIINYVNNAGGFGPNGYYLPLNDSANIGADFHCTPNSIIGLNENLQQPRVSIALTADVFASGGAYSNVLRRDTFAPNILLAAPLVWGAASSGYQDYSAVIKGSGVSKSPSAFQNSPISFASTSIYYGSSAYFTGSTGSYVSYGPHSDFQFGTTDFTVEFWVNPQRRNPSTPEMLLSIGLPFQIYRNVNNEILWAMSTTNTANYFINQPIGIAATNQWTHVAVSRRGNAFYGFINGVCGIGSTAFPSAGIFSATPSPLVLGDYGANIGQFPFQGYMQDVRVYNAGKYTNGFDVPKSWSPININPSVGFSTWRSSGTFANSVPTNQFCSLNALANSNPISSVAIAYSFGNTSAYWSLNGNTTATYGTVGVNTGSWYFEARITNIGNSGNPFIGVSSALGVSTAIGIATGLVPIGIQSAANFGNRTSFIQGDVIGVAYSFTNGRPSTIDFYQNGVQIVPGLPIYSSISTAGFVGCGTADGLFFPAFSGTNGVIWDVNFGDNPSFGGQLPLTIFANNQAAGFTDINGQGTFRYPPPVGYLALCRNNLITVRDNNAVQNPGQYFRTVLYTGDATQSKNITGVGFTGDFFWIKARGTTANHRLFDSMRGPIATLNSNATTAEVNENGSLIAFNADGFSLGNDSAGGVNASGVQYAAWCWRAGAGTTSICPDGTITTGISTSLISGFSVVNYIGNNTANATIGHGLQRPAAFAIIKNRDGANNWAVYHKNLAFPNPFLADLISNPGPRYTLNIGSLTSGYLSLNSTSAAVSYSMDAQTNGANARYVAYVWAEIEGYSRFHEYLGNGNADGPMVTLGFKPALVIIKNASTTGSWRIFDSSRNPINPTDVTLVAEATTVETASAAGITIDLLSNGFKVRSTDTSLNTSLNRYVYAAWAETPYAYANAK